MRPTGESSWKPPLVTMTLHEPVEVLFDRPTVVLNRNESNSRKLLLAGQRVDESNHDINVVMSFQAHCRLLPVHPASAPAQRASPVFDQIRARGYPRSIKEAPDLRSRIALVRLKNRIVLEEDGCLRSAKPFSCGPKYCEVPAVGIDLQRSGLLQNLDLHLTGY